MVVVLGQRKVNAVAGIMNTASRSYANADARMLTAEGSVTIPLAEWLTATASAAYTRATKDTRPTAGITSADVAEIPPASGTLSVRYSRHALFVEAVGQFAATQNHVDIDLQESPTPGYTTVALRVGGELRRVRVALSLDNLLDRDYLNFNSYQRDPYRTGARVHEPRRNVSITMSYKF
jgi:iron complex outermembrane recepter protein